MTWLEFKDSVKEMLTVDANRLGAETYVENLIRQGVIELQEFIPLYRGQHESVFGPEDFSKNGNVSIAYLPTEAAFRDAYFVNVDPWCRTPLTQVDWKQRYQMACNPTGCFYQIAIDDQAKTMYVNPTVATGTYVSLFWDGLKLEFVDADVVPFDEPMVEAVSEYVLARVERRINKDLAMAGSFLKSYQVKRTQLYVRALERARVTSPDSVACGCECVVDDVCDIDNPTCGIDCMEIECDFVVLGPTGSPVTITLSNPTCEDCATGANGLLYGHGSPQGVVTGNVGWIYTDIDSGVVWPKVSGDGTNTGWGSP